MVRWETLRSSMEMRAVEDIDIGQDLTSPLLPLASSLYDSYLHTHCSTCFSLLNSNPQNHHSFRYCSPRCTSASPADLTDAEIHLLHSTGDTSDLRTALRFVFHLHNSGDFYGSRVSGLLSNREILLSTVANDEDAVSRIRDGAKAIAVARRMGKDSDSDWGGDCVVEEAVLCVVLTNAVEVQVKGGGNIGIALYGTDFSWINHSCSPNACYRFSQPEFDGCESRLLIAPASTNRDGGIDDECYRFQSTNELESYGPRVIVRSIKAINKGDEVSIAYTDLLQPKALRLSELLSKYQFTCCCRRCNAFPQSYADFALQEVSVWNHSSTNPSFDEIENLTDYIYNTISGYLSDSNAESCCKNLEKALTQKIKLHPCHILSLNAYTALASAYKVRGTHSLDHNLDSNMISISSAYSFLLATLTHNLFLSESSLIASAANYWSCAGESLINLYRNTLRNFAPSQSPKICDCALMTKFEAGFAEFKDISDKFLSCITNITPKVWSSLIRENVYLRKFDFSLLGIKNNTDSSTQQFSEKVKENIFQLGFHCLLYGGFLSRICWGDHSYLTHPIQSILNGECS